MDSKEGQALIAKCKDIIDCLDPRVAWAVEVGSGHVGSAEAKFGCVCLVLPYGKWLTVTLEVYDESKSPLRDPSPIAYDMSFKTFTCNAIWVMDYGNEVPPVVVFNDANGGDCYVCPYLTRREGERYGVETYGFPGHPASDLEYCKSPADLYKELQELTKTAYDKVRRREVT